MAGRASLSRLFIPTSKDVSATAKVASHQLLLRAGFIRQSASGIYTLLPFAVRSLAKLERLVDEEMESIDASKLSLPSLLSADNWHTTGRWNTMGTELFRLKDRKESDFCLAPTHEEEITHLIANEISSYRQLPLRLYQIGRKYRDELRPRSGLLRGREFIMKDLYTFDTSKETAELTYNEVVEAYKRIFKRMEIPFAIAQADTGHIGGSLSHEFHIYSQVGEDTLLTCSECDYTANEELAQSGNSSPKSQLLTVELTDQQHKHSLLMKACLDRGKYTILKAIDAKRLVVTLISNQRTLNLTKLAKKLDIKQELSIVTDLEAAELVGTHEVHIVIDNILASECTSEITEKATNEDTFFELSNTIVAAMTQTQQITIDDIHNTLSGDSCPHCTTTHQRHVELKAERAIEVGHTFLLGDKYSQPLGATFKAADTTSQRHAIQMGCYGLGITRIIAAVAEATHDKRGLRWPWALAPYRVCIIPLQLGAGKNTTLAQDSQLLNEARQLQDQLEAQVHGLRGEVVVDDRRGLSPGWRLKDAELIGYPWLVVLGRAWASERHVELQQRWTGERRVITPEDLLAHLQKEAQQHTFH